MGRQRVVLRTARRMWIAALAAMAATALAACAANSGQGRAGASPQAAAAALPVLRRDDALWLGRVTFGLDSASVAEYRRLGREQYLNRQLQPRDGALPAPIAAEIEALEVSHVDAARVMADVIAQRKAVNAMPDGPDKDQASKSAQRAGQQAVPGGGAPGSAARGLFSGAAAGTDGVVLAESFQRVPRQGRTCAGWSGDYEERAIRPHVFGRFKDLVLATLEHPAMLQYLDNSQNAAGHINENYARELMELHTLGVNGGYTQQDVQNLARMLTGRRRERGRCAAAQGRVAAPVPAPGRLRVQSRAA